MRQQCASIAKSTSSQCKNKNIPGSQYCILHIEKPPLLVGAFLGVILGYLINWVLPTPELRELRQLRKDVQPVISLAESSFPDLDRGKAIVNLTQEVKELQESLKPRKLTEEQAEYLVTAIKDKSPGDVWLFCKSGDEEACSLGHQIFKILKSANWNIVNNTLHDISISTPNVSSIVGIVITINKDLKSIPLGIELFHKTMLQVGFASRIVGSSKSSVEIWIGAKPQILN